MSLGRMARLSSTASLATIGCFAGHQLFCPFSPLSLLFPSRLLIGGFRSRCLCLNISCQKRSVTRERASDKVQRPGARDATLLHSRINRLLPVSHWPKPNRGPRRDGSSSVRLQDRLGGLLLQGVHTRVEQGRAPPPPARDRPPQRKSVALPTSLVHLYRIDKTRTRADGRSIDGRRRPAARLLLPALALLQLLLPAVPGVSE
jgi:hypothetical protein